MIRVGVVGVSGYSGYTLLTLLLRHPELRLTYVSASKKHGPLNKVWPSLEKRTRLVCEKFDASKASKLCDVVFLAVPHTVAMTIVPKLIAKKLKVIDLSGDYRLKSAAVYKKWYGVSHKDTKRLSKAVYGLPEFYRNRIAKANFISNPGCYPTAALLALGPLMGIYPGSVQDIIIDAKSGVSGAGKKLNAALMFSETNETMKAYKVGGHQHTPEMNQYLSLIADKKVEVTFTPHLVPMNVGIYETIYVKVNDALKGKDLNLLYKKFYKTEPFVRIMPAGVEPEVKNVAGTNYCDIAIHYDKRKQLVVMTAAIDNLVKGAAGQAVQNMNIMCGFKEDQGLV